MKSLLLPMTTSLVPERLPFYGIARVNESVQRGLEDATMPQAGADAVWEALAVCRNGIRF
jgi:hypothetical protein